MTRLLSIITLAVILLLITANLVQNHSKRCKEHTPRNGHIAWEVKEDFLKQRYSAVIEKATETLKVAPLSADLLGMRSISYLKTGDYEKAQEDADKAILKDPSVGWGNYARGLLQLDSGNPEKALTELASASQLKADCSLVFSYIAECELDLLRLNSAEVDCHKALDLYSMNLHAKTIEAEIDLLKLNYSGALKNLQLVLQYNSDSVHAKLIELIALTNLGKKEDLKSKSEKLLALIEPQLKELEDDKSKWNRRKKARLLTARSWVYFLKNYRASALDGFEKSLNIMPDQPLAVEGYARTLLNSGRGAEIKDLLDKYQKRDSSQALSWQILYGVVSYQDREYDKAAKIFKQVNTAALQPSVYLTEMNERFTRSK